MTIEEKILSLPMDANDANARTVREYLISLVAEMWKQKEEFRGKFPDCEERGFKVRTPWRTFADRIRRVDRMDRNRRQYGSRRPASRRGNDLPW